MLYCFSMHCTKLSFFTKFASANDWPLLKGNQATCWQLACHAPFALYITEVYHWLYYTICTLFTFPYSVSKRHFVPSSFTVLMRSPTTGLAPGFRFGHASISVSSPSQNAQCGIKPAVNHQFSQVTTWIFCHWFGKVFYFFIFLTDLAYISKWHKLLSVSSVGVYI